MEIRDKGLYRDVLGYNTFEAYCNERWGFSASRARQLVAAAETFDDLKSVTPGNTPLYEKHIRPLMSLTTEKKQQVWQKAVETAPEGKSLISFLLCALPIPGPLQSVAGRLQSVREYEHYNEIGKD